YNHSFENLREAQYVVHLAFYLFQQGVDPEELHILAPYRAQVACIGKYAERFFHAKKNRPLVTYLQKRRAEILGREAVEAAAQDMGLVDREEQNVEVTTRQQREQDLLRAFLHNITPIDGFQGNQNKYVIISWTRSNAQHMAGFLKRPEGINR
ncbi:unnamed protein product, partial [Amoebophrya sp. A25]